MYFYKMVVLKIILLPFSFLYGIILLVRNKLYDFGVLKSVKFNIPIISVGNLSVGGTGKTPHIEYLIRLLKPKFYIATLSRGYGRESTGFILADTQSTAQEIGDEPLQFKKKFHNLPVAVDEDRVDGVIKTLELFPSIQAILLDDAFQHRQIVPGLSIVLTDYNNLYVDDFILPSGTLREFSSGIKRADIIIVSKCPQFLLPIEHEGMIKKLKPLPHQKIYFSCICYGEFIPLQKDKTSLFSKSFYFERKFSILLVTGIATVQSLEHYLLSNTNKVVTLNFPDHHQYTKNDIKLIEEKFNEITSNNKIIITTEKDMMRLNNKPLLNAINNLPIYYIPIEVKFNEQDEKEFNQQVLNYVSANQKHGKVY